MNSPSPPTPALTTPKSSSSSTPFRLPVTASALLTRKRKWFVQNGWDRPDDRENDKIQDRVEQLHSTNTLVTSHTTSKVDSEEDASCSRNRPMVPLPPRLYLISNYATNEAQDQDADCVRCKDTTALVPPWLELHSDITEIYGEAGSGKTQLTLRLIISCVMLSYNATASSEPHTNHNQHIPLPENPYYHALYISMGETNTSSQIIKRLHQMAHYQASLSTSSSSSNHQHQHYNYDKMRNQYYETSSNIKSINSTSTTSILQRIITKFLYNEEQLHDFLYKELPNLLRQRLQQRQGHPSSRIGLVVLDSIAGIYRLQEEESLGGNNHRQGSSKEDTSSAATSASFYANRTQSLFRLAAQLKFLSHEYGVHFVVTNQVAGKDGADSGVAPSLGLAWLNCVNCRYRTSRWLQARDYGGLQKIGRTRYSRKIELVQSSRFVSSNTAAAPFQIEAGGAVLLRS